MTIHLAYLGLAVTAPFLLAASAANVCDTAPLLNPAQCCSVQAPAAFNVTFVTTKGNFTAYSRREWGPIGVDRFYNLAACQFFSTSATTSDNNAAFFRVVAGFVVQYGIPGNPAVSAVWENAVIANDPYPSSFGLSNTRGVISYAAEQDPNTGLAFNRTTQIFVNYGNNSRLDALGFTPVAVVEDESAMSSVVDQLYSGYGDNDGPDQDTLYAQGDAYLRQSFPLLDYVTGTSVVAVTA